MTPFDPISKCCNKYVDSRKYKKELLIEYSTGHLTVENEEENKEKDKFDLYFIDSL
jgi:hypothetical protein